MRKSGAGETSLLSVQISRERNQEMGRGRCACVRACVHVCV